MEMGSAVWILGSANFFSTTDDSHCEMGLILCHAQQKKKKLENKERVTGLHFVTENDFNQNTEK